MQQQASPTTSAAPSLPTPASPSPLRILWRRLGVAIFAILLALGFVALATIRWNAWVGAAATQVTDDAYVRSDLTHLSSRIAGEVLVVAVTDYQRVKAGGRRRGGGRAGYEAQV